MYDKCYFCLDQLPKLKKESTACTIDVFKKVKPTFPFYLSDRNRLTVVVSRSSISRIERKVAFTMNKADCGLSDYYTK